MSTHTVAIGGNQALDGSSVLHTVKSAITTFRKYTCFVQKVSHFYRTPAFPAGSGPDFVNAVVQVSSDKTPSQMLEVLHEIEAEFGRVRDQRWGARTLDLDLIAAEQQVLPSLQRFTHWASLDMAAQQRQTPDELILPHPRVQDRAFVLVPLCDVAPDWRHPVFGKTAKELLSALAPEDVAAVTRL